MLNFLKGYRTYGCAFLIAGATAAHSLGYLNSGQYDAIVGFLGAGGLAALRAAAK